MSSPWSGPRVRRQLSIAGLILLASIALFAVVMQRAESELGGEATSQIESFPILEVRPAAGSMTFSTSAMEAARVVTHVVAVQRYVVAPIEDGSAPGLRVVGVDVTGPLRLPERGHSSTPEPVKGRAFGPDDAERPVAVVGRDYAKIGKTIYGYQIEGMIDHGPSIRLGGAEVRVIGMFATGNRATDSQVLLPLSIAERALGLIGQASGLYVQVDAPGNLEQVERELRAALGESVTTVRRPS